MQIQQARSKIKARMWTKGKFSAIFLGVVFVCAAAEAEQLPTQEEKTFFASPVKAGMSKEELIAAIGKPYYIAGSKDSGDFLKKQNELRQYGMFMELWIYKEPYNFVVYFVNGKVSQVEYVGKTDQPSAKK